jgi:hypothetical protein
MEAAEVAVEVAEGVWALGEAAMVEECEVAVEE